MKPLLLLALSIALAGCSKPAVESPSVSTESIPNTPGPAPAPAAGAEPVETMSPADATGPITRYHWRLVDATDAKGKRIEAVFVRTEFPLQLDFRHARLTVGNTCNNLVSNYAQAGARLTIGPLVSTLKVCHDDKLATLDRATRSRLEGVLSFVLGTGSKPLLTLTNTTGDKLVFAGEAIPEVRYDGPGKLLFLEVAADTKRCNDPMIPNHRCLQVREIKNDKGVTVGTPGKFLNFYGEIEGYTHKPGVGSVLRISRHQIKNPPAGGSSTVYVLDTVVESDTSGAK